MQSEIKDLPRLLNKLGDYNTFDAWSVITKEKRIKD
jgi:hypothetical protein